MSTATLPDPVLACLLDTSASLDAAVVAAEKAAGRSLTPLELLAASARCASDAIDAWHRGMGIVAPKDGQALRVVSRQKRERAEALRVASGAAS